MRAQHLGLSTDGGLPCRSLGSGTDIPVWRARTGQEDRAPGLGTPTRYRPGQGLRQGHTQRPSKGRGAREALGCRLHTFSSLLMEL